MSIVCVHVFMFAHACMLVCWNTVNVCIQCCQCSFPSYVSVCIYLHTFVRVFIHKQGYDTPVCIPHKLPIFFSLGDVCPDHENSYTVGRNGH